MTAAHLSTLRACVAHVNAHGWRGKRRDAACHTFMLGALAAHHSQHGITSQECVEAKTLVDLIAARGYREINAQLLALTRTTHATHAKHGDDI